MSLTSVRPFFRKILEEMEFNEHMDAFNVENIASSNIDRGFHLMSGPVTPTKQSQYLVEMQAETTIRLFFKGYTDPAATLDDALAAEEALIKKALDVKCNAIDDIKLTTLITSNREQLADSNDNIIVSVLTFNSLVMVQPG